MAYTLTYTAPVINSPLFTTVEVESSPAVVQANALVGPTGFTVEQSVKNMWTRLQGRHYSKWQVGPTVKARLWDLSYAPHSGPGCTQLRFPMNTVSAKAAEWIPTFFITCIATQQIRTNLRTQLTENWVRMDRCEQQCEVERGQKVETPNIKTIIFGHCWPALDSIF